MTRRVPEGMWMLRMAAVSLVAAGAVLGACATVPFPSNPRPIPSQPAVSPLPTPAAPGAAADDLAPPRQIQDSLPCTRRPTSRPLTASELASVRLSLADAERPALNAPGPGYGPGDSSLPWTTVGSVYIGYSIGPMEP